MVLYFTGTGNSEYVARYLGDTLSDEVISLNYYCQNKLNIDVKSNYPYVIVAPIHVWGYPQIVLDMLEKANLVGSPDIYFIGTMQSESGNTYKKLKKFAKKIRKHFRGFCGIEMPSNYIEGSQLMEEEQADEMVRNNSIKIEKLANRIMKKENIEKDDFTKMKWLKSSLINSFYQKNIMLAKRINVDENCNGCGICAENCPIKNIEIINERAVFNHNCVNCFSCINRCPTNAINIKNVTENRRRYVCIEYEIKNNYLEKF